MKIHLSNSLHIACDCRNGKPNRKLVKLLLNNLEKAKIDVNSQDNHGTALHKIAKAESELTIPCLKLLLSRVSDLGINIFARNLSGRTPFEDMCFSVVYWKNDFSIMKKIE